MKFNTERVKYVCSECHGVMKQEKLIKGHSAMYVCDCGNEFLQVWDESLCRKLDQAARRFKVIEDIEKKQKFSIRDSFKKFFGQRDPVDK